MNKSIFLISLLALFAFQSCDNREDFFYESNEAPTLKVLVNNVEVSTDFEDSIKLGNSYALKVSVSDDKDNSIAPYLDNSSSSDFTYSFDAVSKTFHLNGKREGTAYAVFCAKDAYGATAQKQILFTVFNNLPPVARFSVTSIGDREIEVNASESVDKDARFGGAITLYEFDLNGYVFSTYSATVRYKFPTTGTKSIGVRVKDNNQTFSPVVSKSVVL